MSRLFYASLLALCAAASVVAQQLVPGPNINMVSVDPHLNKQNEPAVALSTRNPCHLLAGANDYRAVNLPGLTTDKETGDAWVGVYKSIDCGQTWFSTLMPGYPQDTSTVGLASPVKGLTTGADPTIRAGRGGLFFYSFIAFNRGTNIGKMAVARFLDRNNKESGDPIAYLDTKVWDSGSAGQFLDKPTIAVTAGTGTCSIGGSTVPASTLHLAWTVFVGNSDDVIRTKVYYARSNDCGATLASPPTKLSESYAVNQSAAIAVKPNGNVIVAWRQFSTSKGDTNEILSARSVDGGKSFTRAERVDALTPFVPFDQGTSSRTFRTNAFPTMAVDHTGRVYLAVAVRGFVTTNLDQARVVVTSTTDGVSWSMPRAVDNPSGSLGHQIMPAMTFASGRLHLVWLDFRDDVSQQHDRFIQEIYPKRHTMDVRAAEARVSSDGSLSWATYGVLSGALPAATAPRLSIYKIGNFGLTSPLLKQLEFNPPNMKLYAGGTRPFMGDYIDIAGLTHVPDEATALTTAARTLHAVWTDNRDARIPPVAPEPVDPEQEGPRLDYAALGTPACTPATQQLTATRDANVYTSRISPDLYVAVPGNAKPTGPRADGAPPLQRAFAVLVENRTDNYRRFALQIVNQPSDAPTTGLASFTQVLPPAAPQTTLDVVLPPRSSASRAVYVVSAVQKYPRIRVSVNEVALAPGGTPPSSPLQGGALINPDVSNPDIENPDVENPDVENPDVENAEVHNPDVENPDVENPDVENPDIENPDIENPDVENPDVENPDVENPDVENPDVENPDVENPDVENPDIENGAITDVSFDVTNNGNTTSAYQVKVTASGGTGGYVFQLVGRRVYKTPAARGCELGEKAQNQILFNIPNPDLGPGGLSDPNSPAATNATLLLRPGETVKVTLRAWDKDALPGSVAGQNGVVAPFCPFLGDLCTVVNTSVAVNVRSVSANTDGTQPVANEDTYTAPPIAITTETLPSANVGSNYSATLQASGGIPENYAWTATGQLPAGLALSPGGVVSGVPTQTGTSQFTAQVTDGVQTAARTLSLTVLNAPPVITTASVPGSFTGTVYEPAQLQATGGTPPYTWALQSGSLPAGLTLEPDGRIEGVATAAGTSSFTVQAIDSAGAATTRALQMRTMSIASGDIIVSDGTVGTTTGKLYRLSRDGTIAELIAEIGGRPQAIAFDASHRLLVVDSTNDRVLRVTPGHVETVFSGAPLSNPVAVGVAADGQVLVGDNSTDLLYRIASDGSSIEELAPLITSPNELQDLKIAVGPSNEVLVTDDSNVSVRVIKVDMTGAAPSTVTLPAEFTRASGLAVNKDGNYVITAYAQSKIVTVTPGGAFVTSVAGPGNATGIALDYDESFLVAENTSAAVRHVSTTGTMSTVRAGAPFTFLTDIVQFRPTVTFERFPDGQAACASCQVTTQFTPVGLGFSFVTLLAPNPSVTHVQMVRNGGSARASDGTGHSLTAPAVAGEGGGHYNGVMTMALTGNPKTVMFRVRGNDTIVPFVISGTDSSGSPIPAASFERRNVVTYTGLGSYQSRQETVFVTVNAGVATINVHMNVGLLFLDNVIVRP